MLFLSLHKYLASLAVLYAVAEFSYASAPAQQHTSGCGISHDFTGKTRTDRTLESSGISRSYDIYLPDNYDDKKHTPLIISYHGNGKDSHSQRALDHFDNSTWNPDHIVVWPNGIHKRWEGPDYAHSSAHPDKVFTTDLLNHLRNEYCIDLSRIYAAGKSNGGGFVGSLACSKEHGGDFAAFAACSGAFYTDDVDLANDTCTPARSPLPIMEFHGTNDTTIPYNPTGKKHGGFLPKIPDWLATWGKRNGCADGYKPEVVSFPGHNDTQKTVYTCNNIPVVIGYLVKNMAHSWPSTTPNSDNRNHGDGPVSFDATPIILDFFRGNHSP